ncbi:acetyl-CoA synthetase-like protein [Atractiella rhizophila]|nr:acetyl-CoA synthetase-like protein [Atractiella rhizophila]
MMRGTRFGLVVRCNKPAKRVGLRRMSGGGEGRIFHSPVADIEIRTGINLYSFIFHRSTPPPSPSHPWLISSSPTTTTFTRTDCMERTDGLASVMRRQWDVRRGEVVGVFSTNELDYMNVVWAAHKVGATVNTLNAAFKEEELAHSLKLLTKHYRLKVIFTTPALLPTLQTALLAMGRTDLQIALFSSPTSSSTAISTPTIAQALSLPSSHENFPVSEVSKEDLAFLCLSSGTTGHPKLVKISHDAVVANVLQMSRWREKVFNPLRDRALGVLPFSHIYGLVKVAHFHIYNSIPIVVMPKFDLAHMLEAIQEQKITMLYIVPPMALLLSKSPKTNEYDLSHVHFAMSGAAPLSTALAKEFEKKFPQIQLSQGYGMTEVPTGTAISPVGHGVSFPASSGGQLLPNTRARIVDTLTGEDVGVEERGELRVHSPAVASGYVCEEGEKDDMLDDDGWVKTGDLCYFDKNGFLFVEDRIRVSFSRMRHGELKGLIIGHPDVSDVGVIGVPHEYTGQVRSAFSDQQGTKSV